MKITILTCPYDPQKGVCDTTLLEQFCQEYDVLDYQGQLTTYEGIPMWTVLISYRTPKSKYSPFKKSNGGIQNQTKTQFKRDPFRQLSVEQQPLYNALREWRRQQAEKEGKPVFALIKNQQIADVVRKLPTSIKALKTVDGVGDATCTKYGESIIAIIKKHKEGGHDAGSSSSTGTD